jgi:hypothetical protein
MSHHTQLNVPSSALLFKSLEYAVKFSTIFLCNGQPGLHKKLAHPV